MTAAERVKTSVMDYHQQSFLKTTLTSTIKFRKTIMYSFNIKFHIIYLKLKMLRFFVLIVIYSYITILKFLRGIYIFEVEISKTISHFGFAQFFFT